MVRRRFQRIDAPIAPKPINIIAHVAGSGTDRIMSETL
jgi:hypothetical protein